MNHRLISALLLSAALFLGGCKKTDSDSDSHPAQPPAAQGPVITATPNPVPAGTGPGITTIAWDTGGDGAIVDVYLCIDGGEEKLFGKHSKTSKEVNWIGAGPVYEFRMYPTGDRSKVLGSVKVTRNRK